MADLIDRQAAIDYLMINTNWYDEDGYRVEDADERRKITTDLMNGVPPAEPEEAIPVTWLEEEAKWFESMDNAFAKIEATNIRVMIKKWRVEKDETD